MATNQMFVVCNDFVGVINGCHNLKCGFILKCLLTYCWFSYSMQGLNIGSSLGIWVTSGWASMGNVIFFCVNNGSQCLSWCCSKHLLSHWKACVMAWLKVVQHCEHGPTLWTSPCYVTQIQIDSWILFCPMRCHKLIV